MEQHVHFSRSRSARPFCSCPCVTHIFFSCCLIVSVWLSCCLRERLVRLLHTIPCVYLIPNKRFFTHPHGSCKRGTRTVAFDAKPRFCQTFTFGQEFTKTGVSNHGGLRFLVQSLETKLNLPFQRGNLLTGWGYRHSRPLRQATDTPNLLTNYFARLSCILSSPVPSAIVFLLLLCFY